MQLDTGVCGVCVHTKFSSRSLCVYTGFVPAHVVVVLFERGKRLKVNPRIVLNGFSARSPPHPTDSPLRMRMQCVVHKRQRSLPLQRYAHQTLLCVLCWTMEQLFTSTAHFPLQQQQCCFPLDSLRRSEPGPSWPCVCMFYTHTLHTYVQCLERTPRRQRGQSEKILEPAAHAEREREA